MVALSKASAIFHKQNTEPNWQPLQTTSCFVNPVSVATSVPQSVLYGGSPVPRALGWGASFGNRSPGGVGGGALRDAQAAMHTLQHATSAQSALWCAKLSTDIRPPYAPLHMRSGLLEARCKPTESGTMCHVCCSSTTRLSIVGQNRPFMLF